MTELEEPTPVTTEPIDVRAEIGRLHALADEWHECCGDIHEPLLHAAAVIQWLHFRTGPLSTTQTSSANSEPEPSGE